MVSVREEELQEMVNQANRLVDQDKEKFHQLEVIMAALRKVKNREGTWL